jgi:RNA polymerase sigma factor (sigma-70 family)
VPVVGADKLAPLVARARAGDRDALEELVAAVRDDVYNLALRMLWHPADAEDATQEILVKVVTGLASFRGEAALRTWVHRIAANHLLTTRKRRAEQAVLSFDEFAENLADGLAAPVDDALLEEEVKVGCTHAMLLCLDREHRLSYVLGEVFELGSQDAAWVAGTTPAAHRQRLARARRRIRSFMEGNCGLVDAGNACRCARRVTTAVANGRVDPEHLLFAGRAGVRRQVAAMDSLHAAAAILRAHPRYAAPGSAAREVARILGSPDAD